MSLKYEPASVPQHRSRYIALQLSYVGWGNQGFASQDTTEDTVP